MCVLHQTIIALPSSFFYSHIHPPNLILLYPSFSPHSSILILLFSSSHPYPSVTIYPNHPHSPILILLYPFSSFHSHPPILICLSCPSILIHPSLSFCPFPSMLILLSLSYQFPPHSTNFILPSSFIRVYLWNRIELVETKNRKIDRDEDA